MEKTETLAQRWFDRLAEDGYRPHLEANQVHPERSHVTFKVQGDKFSLYLDETDPTYFYLSLSFLLGDATADAETLLRTANLVNEETKGAKVILDLSGGSAQFNMEWFAERVPEGEQLRRLFKLCRFAADGFFEKVRALDRPVALA